MRAVLPVLLLFATVLAGCSDGGGDDPEDDPTVDLGLSATDTTGVIRGIIVDEAVRPLAGAVIGIVSEGRNTTSTDDGAFGFQDLEPGTYFLSVSKAGYKPVQVSADVVAGIDEPDLVKVLLPADPAQKPYHELLKWEGFIQCSTRFVINALAACSALPVSQDNFTYRIHPAVVPTFAQSEMVWDSTQAAGDGMKVQYTDDSDGLDNYVVAIGGSPLVISANQSLMASKNVGNETGLLIRVFAGSVDGTTPPVCVPLNPCEGVSLVVNQGFTVYTVLFYNFLPPEGWQFSVDGEPKPPA